MFLIDNKSAIYKIPECDMPRLYKGDSITIKRNRDRNLNYQTSETEYIVKVKSVELVIRYYREYEKNVWCYEGEIETKQIVNTVIIEQHELYF